MIISIDTDKVKPIKYLAMSDTGECTYVDSKGKFHEGKMGKDFIVIAIDLNNEQTR